VGTPKNCTYVPAGFWKKWKFWNRIYFEETKQFLKWRLINMVQLQFPSTRLMHLWVMIIGLLWVHAVQSRVFRETDFLRQIFSHNFWAKQVILLIKILNKFVSWWKFFVKIFGQNICSKFLVKILDCRFLNSQSLKWYEARLLKTTLRGSNCVEKFGPS